MDRPEMLQALLQNHDTYDFIVIGGGATGIGIALEASSRGYSAVLLEQSDFAKSTSSKSTKLVHGGVRYLAQGDVRLVREACVERGRLLLNAPHLVKNQSFIIPAFGLWHEIFYTVGLKLYDIMAGSLSLGSSKRISKAKALKRISTFNPTKLSAGIVYHDGQFDDCRLAINSLQTAVAQGAIVLNYALVTGLIKDKHGKVNGVSVKDVEGNRTFAIAGKNVVNATGVFADDILQMDKPGTRKTIVPSQGVHLVLDKKFLPGDDGIMIPKTEDGRVLFAVPWHGKVVVGTTDTPVEEASLEPVALDEEVEFILATAGHYLAKAPKRSDVLSVFAGLRPLAASDDKGKRTKEISRSHKIFLSDSGLLTMVGGKWTTYRKMGEDLVDRAERINKWKHIETKTKNLKIHGYQENIDLDDPMYFYGSDKQAILQMISEKRYLEELISDNLNVMAAEVVWAVKNEMAIRIEDVLARRLRCQLLDAKESLRMAPRVAAIMARELGRSQAWQKEQVYQYEKVTENYILK